MHADSRERFEVLSTTYAGLTALMSDTSTGFHYQVQALAQVVWPVADQLKLEPGAEMDLAGKRTVAIRAILLYGQFCLTGCCSASLQVATVPSEQSRLCSQDPATGKALQA